VIAAVEGLLRDIQNAVASRKLYPPEHPRIREIVDRIANGLGQVLGSREELAVFAADQRVIFDSAPLPGGEPLANGIFRILQRAGYDRLSFRRGIGRGEIEEFLASLAEAAQTTGGGARRVVRATPHIFLASFHAPESGTERPEADERSGFLEAQVRDLKGVWSKLLDERAFDLDRTEAIVLALSKTVEDNLGAVVPLAALKSHDEYTATHIVNVALLAMAMAEAIGLAGAQVRDAGTAALLHDIGKTRVPDAILNKPDALSPEQVATMRRHPEDGARVLLSTAGAPELAAVVAFEHHIRPDGRGYPAVPSGWRLNLASAITQIADVYDALRTERPYRAGLDHDAIRRLMLEDSSSQFDAELLNTFFELVVPRATTPPPVPPVPPVAAL
jgi:putative nucleotidyltransferase with HDIG domain